MKKLMYVPLSPEVCDELVALALANKRHPKHEAARIIELYLRKKAEKDKAKQNQSAHITQEVQEVQHDQPDAA